jgi:tyrosinase
MKFILKINGSENSNAEFVGWTPVKCSLTIDGYSGETPMPVTITPEHKNKNGRIDLYHDNATSAIPVPEIKHDFQNANELTFYVAGKFGHESVAEIVEGKVVGKDTFIYVKSDKSDLELEKEIMVRVRRNANKLEQAEMTNFLEAFVRLNNENTKKEYQNNYSNYPKKLLGEIVLMHTYDAIWEIHQRTSFHPWHRIFNLHLERELQTEIPEVTIPYWKFDEKADRVFTPFFIGETEKSDDPNSATEYKQPKFNMMNPLINYIQNTAWGPLTRAYGNRDPKLQNTFGQNNGDVLTEEDIVEKGPISFEEWSKKEEFESHNPAHNVFTGDVADAGKDPIDPLFFMMHSNVDRLWAKWQYKNNRFDTSLIETYPYIGNYIGKRGKAWVDEWKQNASPQNIQRFNAEGFIRQTNKDIGNYLDDTLWPWDLDTADSRPMRKYNTIFDPEFGEGNVPEIEISFPKSPTSNFPDGPITVRSTIDYQDRLRNKVPLGFDYDDIPYFDNDRKHSAVIAHVENPNKNRFEMNIEKHNQSLAELINKNNDLNVRLNAVSSIDQTSETFIDNILNIIADSNEPSDLRSELINKMVQAKRANNFFPSRASSFFNQLRGLLKDNNRKLRFQAIGILASNEDPVVQDFLVSEIKKGKSDFVSIPEAIFFLRKSPKPQHSELFLELFKQSNNIDVKKAAIKGLGNDPGSLEFLEKVVLDDSEDFKVREAGALSIHNLNHELMNDLAAEIIAKPEPGEGIKLFRSTTPNPDEVDFKAGLLNMLRFTGDINALKDNEELKSSLREVESPSTQNKANFKTSLEAFTAIRTEESTILEQMAKELLARIESNSNE